MAYRFAGKQKTLAIGSFPDVSLEMARKARTDARQLLALGIDPSEQKRLERLKKKVSSANTFRAIGDEYFTKLRREGGAEATISKVTWLIRLANPKLGQRPITKISSAEILDVLRNVEVRGHLETARRLRSTIGSAFRYAISTARADNDPTFALRGSLVVPKVRHRAAITEPAALGGLLRAIYDFDGQLTTRAALRLMLCCSRGLVNFVPLNGWSSIWTRPFGVSQPSEQRCGGSIEFLWLFNR